MTDEELEIEIKKLKKDMVKYLTVIFIELIFVCLMFVPTQVYRLARFMILTPRDWILNALG